jgi:hypothetical protein
MDCTKAAGEGSGKWAIPRARFLTALPLGYSFRFSFRFPLWVFLRSGLNTRSI